MTNYCKDSRSSDQKNDLFVEIMDDCSCQGNTTELHINDSNSYYFPNI